VLPHHQTTAPLYCHTTSGNGGVAQVILGPPVILSIWGILSFICGFSGLAVTNHSKFHVLNHISFSLENFLVALFQLASLFPMCRSTERGIFSLPAAFCRFPQALCPG
jgi:hypothetical protein